MKNSRKVAGIVVLYNPIVGEVIENINSYINDIDCLYCIDNSDCVVELFSTINKVKYIPLKKNIGLAKALSLGCDYAINDGAEILVTLDQDTYFEQNSLKILIKSVIDDTNIVATPNIKRITREKGKRIFHEDPMYLETDTNVSWAITSGSVFPVEIYKAVNGFDNSLFIGQIDQDFCTAVFQKGYKVIRKGKAFIYQEPGNGKKYNFLFIKKGYAPNQSPMRYYYVFRNERYLRNKWGDKYDCNKVALYKYIFVVLLFEDNKYEKLKSMLKGFLDGKKMKIENKNVNLYEKENR